MERDGKEREKERKISRTSLGPRSRCRIEGRETREKGRKMKRMNAKGKVYWDLSIFRT